MTLLPPNATPQERAIEGAIVERVPVPIVDLWNPDTCPAALLPWLAWALSIDGWQSYWPEHVKRARVRTAITVQRKKGTAGSVRQVVAAMGGSVVLREWWENTPPTTPHTFELTLAMSGDSGETTSAQYVDDVIAEVIRTKPVRSHFTFTQGVEASGGIGIFGAAKTAIYRRLQMQADNS